MKRKTHEINVRERIDKSALHLFQTQGYHKTTIRQIIEAAAVKTGTLYHFYKDKEHVFSNMVMEIFDRVVKKTDDLVAPESSALRMACELSFHIHAITLSPQTAELYVVTYNSLAISDKIVNRQVKRIRHLFEGHNPDFTEDDFMIRTMFVKGFMQSLSLKVAHGEELGPKLFISKVTQIILQMNGFSEVIVQQTLEGLDKLDIEQKVFAAMEGAVAMVQD